MILYSITINIDNQVHDEWLYWMKTQHIPDMLKTGLIVDNKILRMLNEVENGGVTYSFQYYLADLAALKRYQQLYEPALDAEFNRRYKDRFVDFRTLLEVVA